MKRTYPVGRAHAAFGLALLSLHSLGCRLVSSASPAPPIRDSDAWADATLRIQRTYQRVLVVTAGGVAPRTLGVRPLGLNDRHPHGAELTQRVDETFSTLQAAVSSAHGGDLIAVMPGRYAGAVIDDIPGTGDGRYVHLKAMGSVVIDSPAHADGDRWMILVRGAHHIVLEGFDLSGVAASHAPQARESRAPWAGIMLDGDFARTGKLTHHVVVLDNVVHHQLVWGLHSTDTRFVLIQGNIFAYSEREHGAYVSDGSDDYVIRRNVFFGNHAAGLQCNLDPVASFEEVLGHPSLAGYPRGQSAAWARELLARADAMFGPKAYPDGRGENFIIEENVMNENGRGGGGALNLAGLSDSLIQNNLLYGNHAHGIAQWNNDNPFDRELEEPGPRVTTDVEGPQSLPMFGCQNNVIRNNTVLMSEPGRAALQAVYGSFGSQVVNNVLINDAAQSIEVSPTGVYRLAIGPNVTNSLEWTRNADSLLALATSLPDPSRVSFGVTRALFAGEVHRYDETPWLIADGHAFRLNPDRPDFHPRNSSFLLAGRGDMRDQPARDLEGAARRTADIGAYAAED